MESTEIKSASPKAPTAPARPEFKIPKPKKKRRWIKVLIVLVILAALVFWFLVRPILSASSQIENMLYQTGTAEYRDLTVSVSGTGTVEPADSYQVTALVKGEILDAPFEEGDQVEKGDVLYQIDSSDVQNSIERAEITVEQARLSYQNALDSKEDAAENTDVKASDTGVIQKLYYGAGDTVTVGTPIADILDRDTMKLTIPFHSADAAAFYVGESATVYVDGTAETLQGTVESISPVDQAGTGGTLVREITITVSNPGALSDQNTGTASVGGADCAGTGAFDYAAQSTVTARTSGTLASLTVSEGDRVTKDQIIGAFEATDMDSQIKNAELSLRSAELSLQSTKDQLENYTITSPISGTVIEKNYKAGDNLDTTAAAAGYLAVIYDMSSLSFTMNIDELYIGQIEVGQEVRITADALEGQEFTGHVSKININGTTMNGVTTYPVTVAIDNPGDLLPGMNVSAEILVEHAEHVLCVPVEMVGRGDVVQVLPADAYDKDGNPDYARLVETPVELGRNDDQYIEILSGLSEGDTVVYKMEQTNLIEQLMTGAAQSGGAQAGGAATSGTETEP
ncbi:HlyD family efflux transporter periplasmic adaptor subunit [Pseudoflavonifractor sp. CLA-AP-H29]|uniref:HlyD family efflux transporter periplasmic adaptor subunit n=1 Tax=Pseudoflavonifractor intestinihominis TaxID=3133171 RepID=A0ABV1E7D2_9FIRM